MGFEGLAYTGTPHDRAADRRGDPGWTADRLARADTRVIPLWRDRCLLSSDGTPVDLAGAAAQAVAGESEQVALLGLDGPRTVFTADLSHLSEADAVRLGNAESTADVRRLAAALPLPEAATLAYARGVLYWNRHQRFCGSCGAPTIGRSAGHVRACSAAGCGREHFPRIEPAVIVLVESPEPPARCLLARHHGAGPDGFSLLAGFVEIGESLEGAVRRELAEEAGVAVGEVTYRGSQGWPFPAGLMVGFFAKALDERIEVDGNELREARWFTREQLVERIVAGPGSGPSDSIGGRLMRSWAGLDAGVPDVVGPDSGVLDVARPDAGGLGPAGVPAQVGSRFKSSSQVD
ncbi:NAD(+) diphosphatase [Rugosimonospora africana]|uniref:NAD(+) diphosphatase n=1 Tax=Rugosimonospora africana TaxID=556532 RepID=A0A8J3R1H7_9ACTN|nr:NAD(+) diphosphatase [Rugosimonospora africana]GIH20763.1 NADH pyrophosphatase [Rugosimonospora africana]